MSTIIADNLTGKTSAGNVTVTSEGGATTFQLQQGLVKQWANVSGEASPVIDDSLNSSSMTDVSAGRRKITFTNNANNRQFFTIHGMLKDGNSGSARGGASVHFNAQETSYVDYSNMYGSTAASDGNFTDGCTEEGSAIVGDLA
jgi:hypothetical protein